MIWSHVTGCRDGSMPAFCATDLRYQSSCLLAEHFAASSAWPPLSGLMYQLRVAAPEPPPPPQAPSTVANRTRAMATGHFRPLSTLSLAPGIRTNETPLLDVHPIANPSRGLHS